MNWYSKLTVAVRWKGHLSYQFCVTSGVRQGSSLSPSIFNVYMNASIVKLRVMVVTYVANLWVAFSMLTTLSYYRLLSVDCKICYIAVLKLAVIAV